jgi:hypothetical protein
MSFDIPVLLLIFNRPATTKEVIKNLEKIKPRYLFVSADGPRQNVESDFEKCDTVRRIVVENINWECEIKRNFREKNLGCKLGVSDGINWFFENVSEGIIIEDDCLVDISFFNFCKELLIKYRDDERIMHIGAANFQDGKKRNKYSYYFSKMCHVWGWATWKRAWSKYDVTIQDFPEFVHEERIKAIYSNSKIQKYFLRQFEKVFKNQLDTWDYQWVYTVWKHNGLSIIPNNNMVKNIGFHTEATHTKNMNSKLFLPRIEYSNEMITHPKFFLPDLEADYYTFRTKLYTSKIGKLINLMKRNKKN